jgi:hypothetical protein
MTGSELDELIGELAQNALVVAVQSDYIHELLAEPLPDPGYIPNDPFVTTGGVFWSEGSFGNAYPDLYGVRNVRALEAFDLMDLDGGGSFGPAEVGRVKVW